MWLIQQLMSLALGGAKVGIPVGRDVLEKLLSELLILEGRFSQRKAIISGDHTRD